MVKRPERRIKPAIMVENHSPAIRIDRRPELLRRARKIDFFAMTFPVVVMERMHCAKCNSLKREHSQADVKSPDQCHSDRKAGHDQSLSMLHHFPQHRVCSQIDKSAADMRHDQAEPKGRSVCQEKKSNCTSEKRGCFGCCNPTDSD